MEYIETTELARLIRKALKSEFGNTIKFSVRKKSFSGGRSISVTVKKADKKYFKTIEEFEAEYADFKLEHPQTYENIKSRFLRHDYFALNEQIMEKIDSIVNQWNWRISDPYADFDDVNYYTDIGGYKIELI